MHHRANRGVNRMKFIAFTTVPYLLPLQQAATAFCSLFTANDVICLLLVRRQEWHLACKKTAGMVICLDWVQTCMWSSWYHCYIATVSCFSKIQTSCIFLVPTQQGSLDHSRSAGQPSGSHRMLTDKHGCRWLKRLFKSNYMLNINNRRTKHYTYSYIHLGTFTKTEPVS